VRSKRGRREAIIAALAVGAGWAIALLDSRPGWDDTAITVTLLLTAAFVASLAAGRRPWLWALLVGAWTPLLEIGASGATGSILAVLIAAIGAFAGFGLARAFAQPAPR
jgi:hypothetical protein